MPLHPNPQRTLIPLPPQQRDLPQVTRRRRGAVPALLNGVVVVQKRRRPPIDLARPLVECSGSVGAELALKESEMQVLVHDVPVDELPAVSAHHGINPSVRSSPQVDRRESPQPRWLEPGVLPEHVVAADRDATGFGKLHDGVGDGVVLCAAGSLGGVPENVFRCGGFCVDRRLNIGLNE